MSVYYDFRDQGPYPSRRRDQFAKLTGLATGAKVRTLPAPVSSLTQVWIKGAVLKTVRPGDRRMGLNPTDSA